MGSAHAGARVRRVAIVGAWGGDAHLVQHGLAVLRAQGRTEHVAQHEAHCCRRRERGVRRGARGERRERRSLSGVALATTWGGRAEQAIARSVGQSGWTRSPRRGQRHAAATCWRRGAPRRARVESQRRTAEEIGLARAVGADCGGTRHAWSDAANDEGEGRGSRSEATPAGGSWPWLWVLGVVQGDSPTTLCRGPKAAGSVQSR